jgi:hypothetical protein
VTLERIVAENEVSGREKQARVGILRIRVGCGLEIAVGSDVIASAVCGIAGSGQRGGVRGIETEDFFVLGEFGGVVVRLGEKFCSLEVGSWSRNWISSMRALLRLASGSEFQTPYMALW